MKGHVPFRSIGTLLLAALATPAAAQMMNLPQTTRVVLFEGHMAAIRSTSPSLEGGSVIVLGSLASASAKGVEERDNARLMRIAKRLQDSLGLSSLDLKQDETVQLFPGKERGLSASSIAPRLAVALTLKGHGHELSTYRVRVTDAGKELANSLVTVPNGEPGVVGVALPSVQRSLFLVVRRLPPSSAATVSPPIRVSGDPPSYPECAQKARLQGLVILEAHIDKSGKVTAVRVLKPLPMGLSEAAAKAVSKWRFKPAHTADGTPVEVEYRMNIQFRLVPPPKPTNTGN